jgi:cytochrome P450
MATNAGPEVTTDFDMWDVKQTGPHPYRRYAELRDQCPIGFGKSEHYGGFYWTVDHATMSSVAFNPEVFSSNPGTVPRLHIERPWVPLMTDPPDHRGYRKILNPFFTVQRLSRLESPIRAYTMKLCEELATRGTFDGVADFAARVPIVALSMFFKLPEALHSDFVKWTEAVSHDVTSDPEGSAKAAGQLAGALSELILERRDHPIENDLLSELARLTIDGSLTHDICLDMCVILVVAGAATSQHGIANSLQILAEHPEIKQRLIDQPELIPGAIEEFLRYDGPAQFVARRATCPYSVAGQGFAQDDDIVLAWAAGNRDPKVFDKPDEIDIERSPNKHVAFGAGIHHCVGANLGRLEMRIALEEFLTHMPEFEVLDKLDDPEKWVTGIVRGPRIVPIRVVN